MRKKKDTSIKTRQKSIALLPNPKGKGATSIKKPVNKLYYGDNLEILRKYIKDESVDLCYIDPPFNSKRTYNQIYNNIGKEDQAQAQAFIDTWTWDTRAEEGLTEITTNDHGVFTKQSIDLIIGLERVLTKGSLLSYLVHLTLRIAEIYRVLKPTGSFYLHCDQSASHYLKLILDSIFCAQAGEFQNEIIWKRKTGRGETNHKSYRFGISTDTILFYTKSDKSVFNSQFNFNAEGYDEYVLNNFKYTDENGRKYMSHNLASPTYRPNLVYKYKGFFPPKNGWAISLEKMKAWDEEGRLIFPKTADGRIRRKRYLDELKGRPVQNLWDDVDMISSQAAERLGYPTQKPEALLERIIQASSNEGDVVLDVYCGCGTSVAVAERLNRKWIGVDITYQSISLILKRLEENFGGTVVNNIELTGVPEDFESAEALANKKDDRTRKEFEKWAVLTYSNNRAVINEKKGGDGGIDGTAYFIDLNDKNKEEYKSILFSVKSSRSLAPSVIRDLYGTLEREKASLGILITLYPMENLVKESKKYGLYHNIMLGQHNPKIQVISIDEILAGKTMRIPTSLDVLKGAEEKTKTKQGSLFL